MGFNANYPHQTPQDMLLIVVSASKGARVHGCGGDRESNPRGDPVTFGIAGANAHAQRNSLQAAFY
jgi:hypothetical protein